MVISKLVKLNWVYLEQEKPAHPLQIKTHCRKHTAVRSLLSVAAKPSGKISLMHPFSWSEMIGSYKDHCWTSKTNKCDTGKFLNMVPHHVKVRVLLPRPDQVLNRMHNLFCQGMKRTASFFRCSAIEVHSWSHWSACCLFIEVLSKWSAMKPAMLLSSQEKREGRHGPVLWKEPRTSTNIGRMQEVHGATIMWQIWQQIWKN